jgi:U4/U6.U5 tri-snRNP-associated protein 1
VGKRLIFTSPLLSSWLISVGLLSAVPQLEDYLDNAVLAKAAKATGKSKGKKKDGEESTPVPVVDITGFTNNPAFVPLGSVNGASNTPSPGSAPAPSMMKPSFARVTGETSSATSGAATPVGTTNGDRSKVVIGFGMKRKAVGEEGSATPPTKRK